MRYAVLSDIHGNLQALDAVLEDIGRQAPDSILCGGDIVGYGARPTECCRRIMELWDKDQASKCVLGNHDEAALGGDVANFNEVARAAALWTREALEEDAADWLRARPFTLSENGLLLVHPSAHSPELYEYVTESSTALRCAAAARDVFQRRVTALGHSHSAFAVHLDLDDNTIVDGQATQGELKLSLEENHACVVNVGSVGQPRDRDARACYALIELDEEKVGVELRRVDYDIEKAQREILAAGLPEVLAQRLELGI